MASEWPGKGHGALLKNPSTPLPGLLQGKENPTIAVFWPCYLSVWMRFWTTQGPITTFSTGCFVTSNRAVHPSESRARKRSSKPFVFCRVRNVDATPEYANRRPPGFDGPLVRRRIHP
jgi:hypothetical protein